MTSTITERVARGAALLDEREPGWHQRINLERLWMRMTCDCILGQLYDPGQDDVKSEYQDDGYWVGLRALNIPAHPVRYPEAYGFAAEDTGEYNALDKAWRELIGSRRAGEPRG